MIVCLGIAWYLHNDMQFHWIAPLALIPFVLGRKAISFIMATIFVLIGIDINFIYSSLLSQYVT